MRKTTRLRQLVSRPEIAFLMEAHSGLSARIVEEAGFEGIWGSGLTISASFAVRDNNELSWAQVTDHVAFMAEATSIPRTRSSAPSGSRWPTSRNSAGRSRRAEDSQDDPDFVLVARVEALIAGWGLAEALRRAEAYHLAGADAILMHSRSSSPAEIFAFLGAWDGRAPVVLVPTKYWRTPTADFRARGVSVVIWANHLLRASITAMQDAARRVAAQQSLLEVEPQVTPLQEVFRGCRGTRSWRRPSGATCRPPGAPRSRACSTPAVRSG